MDLLRDAKPALSAAQVLEAAKALFGVSAKQALELGSERDQAFMLVADGLPKAVLKVSNVRESPSVLDMEAAAVQHALAVDRSLPLVLPLQPQREKTKSRGRLGPEARLRTSGVAPAPARAQWTDDGEQVHWCRLYAALPGETRSVADGPLPDALLTSWGEVSGRLSRALRSFAHPAAQRLGFAYDVRQTASLFPLLRHVRDRGVQQLCASALAVYDLSLARLLPRLRHQFLHADLHPGNVLVRGAWEGDGAITGVVDFGDAHFTSLVADIAASLANIGCAHARGGLGELRRAARLLLDGYSRWVALEEEELGALADAWMLRCAAELLISHSRIAAGLEPPARGEAERAAFAAQLALFGGLDSRQRRAFLGTPGPLPPLRGSDSLARLVRRREAAIGPGSEPLSYATVEMPGGVSGAVQPVSGDGPWLHDAAGGPRLLDCYNNVAVLGHCHPRVASAVAAAARRPNVNQRYLAEATVSLAERLLQSAGCGLDTCFLVNSGSEAVDLAWRLAAAFTRAGGGLCTDWAYHGVTAASVAFSPETASAAGHQPAHVQRWAPPDPLRGTGAGEAAWRAAHARLVRSGHRLAATILDGLVTSDGIQDLPPAYVQAVARLTREAGGLYIADEVQAGYGRTGEMWSFTRAGVQPDVVTVGKPMGNGFPVAAVLTRREVADALVAREGVYFSTFGGSPMAAAAAHAVLDVFEDEHVLPRVRAAGEALRAAVAAAAAPFPCVGDVRGAGLMSAIELVVPGGSHEPDAALAAALLAALRRRCVLVGRCGRAGNVLKVRPPLAFTAARVPFFVDALVASLAELLDPAYRPPPALDPAESSDGGGGTTESGGRASTEERSESESEESCDS